MNITKKIEIKVTGPVGCGKSSILQEVKEALETYGIGVVYAERAQRNNPPRSLEVSENWERPNADRTVVVLLEEVSP